MTADHNDDDDDDEHVVIQQQQQTRMQVLDFVETTSNDIRVFSRRMIEEEGITIENSNHNDEHDGQRSIGTDTQSSPIEADEEDGTSLSESSSSSTEAETPEMARMRARVQARIEANRRALAGNGASPAPQAANSERTVGAFAQGPEHNNDSQGPAAAAAAVASQTYQPAPGWISVGDEGSMYDDVATVTTTATPYIAADDVVVVVEDDDDDENGNVEADRSSSSSSCSEIVPPPPVLASTTSQQLLNEHGATLLLVEAQSENLSLKLTDHRVKWLYKIFLLIFVGLSLGLLWVTISVRPNNNQSNNNNQADDMEHSSSGGSLVEGLNLDDVVGVVVGGTSNNQGIHQHDNLVDDINDEHEEEEVEPSKLRLHDTCGTKGRWNQMDYRGTINVTRSGLPCNTWEYSYGALTSNFPNSGIYGADNNYCRSPNSKNRYDSAYCLVSNTGGWEYCDVPACGFCGTDQNIDNMNIPSNTSDCTRTCSNDSDCDDDDAVASICLFDTKCHLWRDPNPETPTISYICGDSAVAQANYRGSINVTSKGYPCQYWSENHTPHQHLDTPDNFPFAGLEDNNFCRNPTGRANRAWCYTQDPEVEWAYCTVPFC